MAEDEPYPGGIPEVVSIPDWVEEAEPVSSAGPAGQAVIEATSGPTQQNATNNPANDNILKPGITASEAAFAAAAVAGQPLELNGTIDGANTSLTSASGGSSSTYIKTSGSKGKKISLGFSLGGYKSIITSSNGNGTNSINGLYQGGNTLYQGSNVLYQGGNMCSLADDEICWLISVLHTYENEGRGWDQNVNNAPKDHEGQTVGAWSITQKSNFDKLVDYMKTENISAEYVQAFQSAHGSSDGSKNVHPDRNNPDPNKRKYKSIKDYIDELVKPQYKDTDNYKKFISATTKMFADTWWKATLIAIDKSGVKTRLGRTTIIVMMIHTGR